jgi:Spy/CpxP family protein refolding chaperone
MKKIVVVIVAALAMVSVQVYSQPEEGKGLKKIMKELKLTDVQKKDVEKIQLDMKKQMIDQESKIKTTRLELQQLFKADTPDKSAIESKLKEIAKLEVETKMIRVDSWFSVNSLLTPEQQKTWKNALEFGPAMKQHMMKEGGPMMRHKGMK